jgi:fibronectin-binding autotransporter adhesin
MASVNRTAFLASLHVTVLAAGVLSGVSAQGATTFTWTNGASNGSWDTTSANWTGGGTLWVDNAADSAAVFGATGAGNVAIPVGETRQAYSLTFNSPGYTISGGTINVGGGGFAGSADATISATITGSGNFTKNGAGILTLSGNNTFGGTWFDASNGAVIRLAHNNALGTVNYGHTYAGGTFQVVGGVTIANALYIETLGVGGNGALRSTSGNNTWSGQVRLNTPGGDVAIGVDADTLTITQAIVQFQSNPNLVKVGAGTLILQGAGTYGGSTKIQNGTIRLGVANGLPAGTALILGSASTGGILDLNGYSQTVAGLTTAGSAASDRIVNSNAATVGALTVNLASGTNIFAGVLGNSGQDNFSLTKTGAGTLMLTGVNTYSAGTTVNAGTLQLSGGNNRLYNGGAITVSGTGVLDLGGNTQATSGAVSFQGGTVQNGTISKSGAVYDGQSGAISAVLAGGVGLTKTGTGTLVLSGANTYTGTTTITAGTLQLAGGDNRILSTTSLYLGGAGTLDLNGQSQTFSYVTCETYSTIKLGTGGSLKVGAGDMWNGTAISGDGAFYKVGAGTLTFAGVGTYTGGTFVQGGNLTLYGTNPNSGNDHLPTTGDVTIDSGATLSLSHSNGPTTSTQTIGRLLGYGTVNAGATANRTVTFVVGNGGGSSTFNGTIANGAGTVILTKTGAGTLTLTGANSYSGLTTVSAGALNIQNVTGLGTTAAGTTVASGAALELQGGIAVGAEALTLNGSGISGGGALRSLSGTNSWAGAVTLSTATTIGVDADSLTISGAVGGTGALTKAGSGTLTLSNPATSYTGTTTVSAGTMVLQNTGGSLGTGFASSITNNATVEFNESGSHWLPFNLTFTGSGTWIKSGTGTLWFDRDVISPTGQINITAGKLGNDNLNSNWSGASAGMDISSGATFDLRGDHVRVDKLTGAGAITNSYGRPLNQVNQFGDQNQNNLTVGAAGGSGTFSGSIQDGTTADFIGRIALVKIGAGTQTLSGTGFTYTGPTTIQNGTLEIVDARGFKSPITINAGANLLITSSFPFSTRWTYASALSGAGTLTKTGSGTFGVYGAVNLSGQINIQQGTLHNDNLTADWSGNTANVDISSGATLDLRGDNITVNALTGTGTVENSYGDGTNILTLGVANGSGVFSGVIEGNGTGTPGDGNGRTALIKTGAGTQSLVGTNTYAGGTLVNGGVLSVSSNDNLGSVGGSLTLDGGTLQATESFQTTTRPIVLGAGGATFDVAAGKVLALGTDGPDITGPGGLTKDGAGELKLFELQSLGKYTYLGPTVVKAGRLTSDNLVALPTNSDLTVMTGATFNKRGANTILNKLEGGGSIISDYSDAGFSPNLVIGNNGGSSTFSGSIGSDIAVIKNGDGTQVLSGVSTYTGATTVNGGTLALSGSGRFNSSTGITIDGVGARFITNSSVAVGVPVTVTRGTVGGTGTINVPVAIGPNAIVSPGNSPGTQNYAAMTWAGGGTYLWEINDAAGQAGQDPGWDLLSIAGALTITATSANPFTIDITSLSGSVPGEPANLDDFGYWTIATAAGGITGFDADAFVLDRGGFSGALAGNFAIFQEGNSIVLGYVPEPNAFLLAILGLLGLLALRRRPAR